MEVTHTQDESEFLTISEAARIANLSVDTLRRYGDTGKITVYRTPANHRRFKRADVETLVEKQGPATRRAVAS